MICHPCGRQEHSRCLYPSACTCQHRPTNETETQAVARQAAETR